PASTTLAVCFAAGAGMSTAGAGNSAALSMNAADRKARQAKRDISILLGDEFERGRIHAVTLAGGFWAVVEDVTQVRFATCALHLRAPHSMSRVGLSGDVLRYGRARE